MPTIWDKEYPHHFRQFCCTGCFWTLQAGIYQHGTLSDTTGELVDEEEKSVSLCTCLYKCGWNEYQGQWQWEKYAIIGVCKDHKLGLVILMNLNSLIHSPGSDNPSCEITLWSIIISSEVSNTFYLSQSYFPFPFSSLDLMRLNTITSLGHRLEKLYALTL